MKYLQKDFTQSLKANIQNTESALKEYSDFLLSENKSIFAAKNLEFHADFDVDGINHFQTGYQSTVSIGVSEIAKPTDELIHFHFITIWKCQRRILGFPTSKNRFGSQLIGEFVEESIEEIKEELNEYIEEFLSEDH